MTDPLSAMAEPSRRRLLHLLVAGPQSVTDLAAEFPVTRSAISQHLLVLEDAGLVTATKHGRQRIYAIRREGMAKLHAELELFWTAEFDLLVADADDVRHTRPPQQGPPMR